MALFLMLLKLPKGQLHSEILGTPMRGSGIHLLGFGGQALVAYMAKAAFSGPRGQESGGDCEVQSQLGPLSGNRLPCCR